MYISWFLILDIKAEHVAHVYWKTGLNLWRVGGGCPVAPLPCLVFCPLLKISLVNPYLKILDLAKLFVADAPIKKKV